MISYIIYRVYFLDNKYTRIYFKIVENRRKLGTPTCYCEQHHIIPEQMGGQNDAPNRVLVTAREHFILHGLLRKMCVNGQHRHKMFEAYAAFSINTKRQIKFTSRQQASLREANAQAASIRNRGNQAWKCRGPTTPERLLKSQKFSSSCRWINNGIEEKFEILHEDLVESGDWEYGRIKQTKPRKPRAPAQQETRIKNSIASKKNLTGKKKSESHIRSMSEQRKLENQIKVQCIYCRGVFGATNYKVSHGEHCKLNPVRSQKSLDLEEKARINQKRQQENAQEKECPHCGFASKQHANLKRWHMDNCKHKK